MTDEFRLYDPFSEFNEVMEWIGAYQDANPIGPGYTAEELAALTGARPFFVCTISTKPEKGTQEPHQLGEAKVDGSGVPEDGRNRDDEVANSES